MTPESLSVEYGEELEYFVTVLQVSDEQKKVSEGVAVHVARETWYRNDMDEGWDHSFDEEFSMMF